MSLINNIIDDYENKGVCLKIQMLEDGETILFQGNKMSLTFFAKILLALADGSEDSFQMSPNGAGQVFFDSKSQFGLYLSKEG